MSEVEVVAKGAMNNDMSALPKIDQKSATPRTLTCQLFWIEVPCALTYQGTCPN